jgi:hypothetical protein
MGCVLRRRRQCSRGSIRSAGAAPLSGPRLMPGVHERRETLVPSRASAIALCQEVFGCSISSYYSPFTRQFSSRFFGVLRVVIDCNAGVSPESFPNVTCRARLNTTPPAARVLALDEVSFGIVLSAIKHGLRSVGRDVPMHRCVRRTSF